MPNDAPREVITKAEFARRVGISKQRVSQLTQAGSLPVTADGRIPWPDAQRVWLARKAEDDNPDQQDAPQPRSQPASRRVHPVLGQPRAAAGAGEQTETAIRSSLTYAEARAVEKTLRAQLLGLRLKREKGELITREEAMADARAALASLRASVLALPGRVSLLCEGKSAAEVQAVLEDAVNALLAEWNQGRFAGPGPDGTAP